MLGITQTELDDALASANVTLDNVDSCANGIIYIENAGGDPYQPPTDSTCENEGIMVVTGDVIFKASFEFKGIVYVEGDLNMSGQPFVLGAVAVQGVTDGVKFQAGTPTATTSSTSTTLPLSSPRSVLRSQTAWTPWVASWT